MDYTKLSLAEVRSGLEDVIRDARTTFGELSPSRLNWKPDATQWSVAQCFQHLLTANEMMLRESREAMSGASRSVWQRLPFVPTLLGRALIRSQSPGSAGKYKAPRIAQPTASDIAPDIVERFADQQRAVVTWMDTLDEQRAAGTNMTSPFINVIAYSVLDGARLMLAHDHRHVAQALRVAAMIPSIP